MGWLSVVTFFKVFGIALLITVPLFVITIILFIRDGILAKREERKRKTCYTVMFIISMVIIALVVALSLLLTLLSMLVIRGM